MGTDRPGGQTSRGEHTSAHGRPWFTFLGSRCAGSCLVPPALRAGRGRPSRAGRGYPQHSEPGEGGPAEPHTLEMAEVAGDAGAADATA